MRVDVVPLVGIGPVRLGMTRDQVRAAVDMPPFSFRKGAEVDAFYNNALQVFYAADCPTVEFVEVSLGPELEPWLDDLDLSRVPVDEVVASVSKAATVDDRDPEQGLSYVFPALGLSLWRRTLPESPADLEGRYFDTVSVGTAGYFDGRRG